MKKAIAVLLVLCMLLSAVAFTGCAQDTDNSIGTESQSSTEQTPEETVDTEQEALDKIKVDFGGKEFNILTRSNIGVSLTELKQDAESDEALSQSIFVRNTLLSEKCNLVYVVTPAEYTQIFSMLRSANSAHDTKFTLAFPDMSVASSIATANLLHSFEEVENLNLSEEWWDQGTRELILENGVYYMNGAANYMSNEMTYLMMFSKVLTEKLQLGSMYEHVYNNEWTLEKFNTFTSVASKNLDGNEKFDKNDQYGFIGTHNYGNAFFYASDMKFIDCGMDKAPTLAMTKTDVEKITTLLDKVRTIYYTNNASYISPGGDEATGMAMFSQNQGLFYGEVAGYITALRGMSDDFGVVPIPKYSETQKNYTTHVASISSTMCIPITISDDDLGTYGAIIEAMAILSQQNIRPAYYNITLQGKSIRDEESAGMLDIIFAHRIYDLCQYYDLGLSQTFQQCVNSISVQFASRYQCATGKFDIKVKTLLKNLKGQ